MEQSPSRKFFRGAELARLLVLAVLMVAGWGLFWEYVHKQGEPAEPEPSPSSRDLWVQPFDP